MFFSCREARTLGAVGSTPASTARPAASNVSAAGDGRGKRPSAADTARAERAKKARAEPAKETRPVTSATPSTPVRTKAPSAPPEIVVIDDLPTAPAPDAAPSPPARKTGGETAPTRAGTATASARVETATAQADLETTPATAPTREPAPGAELTVREAGSVRAVGLLEKLQKEYAGIEVDPAADPAKVQTGRLDQLPNATHSRIASAATEIKNFAEGMIRKLSAADHSLLVSASVLLWGRASAPTRCSPRDSG